MEMSRPSRRGIATAHAHDGSAIYPGSPHKRGAEDLACKSIAGSYAAEIAAREMGGLSLADALMLCELLAKVDPLDPGSHFMRKLRAAGVRRLRDSRPDFLDRTALSRFAAARRVGHRLCDLDDELPVGLQFVRSLRLERRLRGLQCRQSLALHLVRGGRKAEPCAMEVSKLADELTRAALLRLCDVPT